MMCLPELYQQVNIQSKEDNTIALSTYFKQIKLNEFCEVMDVGCGPGNVTSSLLIPALPESIKKLVAVDISEEMINFARRKYTDNDKIMFRVMNITTEKIPKEFLNRFDHIVSLYCFHMVFDHKQALSNIYKMLQPGGNVFLNFMGYCIIFDVYKSLKEEKEWSHYLRRYNTIAPPTQTLENPTVWFEKLLTEVGFKAHYCVATKKEYIYPRSIFEKLVLAVNFFQFLVNLEESFVNYHMDYLKKKNYFYIDSDGIEYYRFPYTLLTVYGSKPVQFQNISGAY
ncbi:hypothetical protein FQR65_LT06954 [Abscondita terminalis]|nr:hypothetical protein FQR65_LT06954 [Abscondita terminalis]